MKRLSIMMMAVALVLGMAQCKKTIKQITPGGGEGVYVTVTAGCDGAKTDIAATGITNWSAGDKLYVVGATQGYLGELTIVNYSDANPSNWAEFAGNIAAISGTQNIHFYYFGKNGLTAAEVTSLVGGTTTHTYSIATQDGTLDGIENTMHLVHGSKTNVAAGTTKFGNVTMSNMMAIARFDISGYAYPSAICNAIASASLDLTTGELSPGSAADIKLSNPSENYYMALIPSGTAQTFSFKQNASDLNPVTKSRTIAAGKFYVQDGNSITVKHGVPGFLGGDFSVSATKKVQFSHGNLQFRASDKTWRFANRQWQYLGTNGYTDTDGTFYASGNTTAVADRPTQINWIDLFGHATGDVNHATAYPWQSSSTASNYLAINTNDGFASSSNIYDWGHNIGDGSTWYTLTNDQWVYLLNTRSASTIGSTNDSRFARVRITDEFDNVINGLFIFPDVISWDASTMGSVPTGINSDGSLSWNSTTLYTYARYQAIESAGVVFLPANGARLNLAIDNTDKGYYRSSSYTNKPNYLLFMPSGVHPSGKEAFIYHGLGVRLVRDASNGGGGAEPFGGTNW